MNILPTPKNVTVSTKKVAENGTNYCVDSLLASEEYAIIVKDDGSVNVSYSDEAGKFYAEQTLRQLRSGGELTVCVIHDKPSFAYRSFMIDCARHMFELDEIKKLIDIMALFKMNKFHWHLTDDQGWRIESERFEKLNTVSAVRKYSDYGKTHVDGPYGRVYTKDELREIVDYCAERFIEVIPEFDIPGHTSSLLAAYPELSCGKKDIEVKTHQGIYNDVLCISSEKTYEAIYEILDEICEIFPSKYFHIGGDETPSKQWEGCPDCQELMRKLGIKDYKAYQNYFTNKIIKYLGEKGKTCIVWNDAAASEGLDNNAIVQYWKEVPKPTVRFANGGGKIILSPFSYYYTDYDYYITPLNRTYAYVPELKGLNFKSSIIGVEVPVWTEYISDNDHLEEMFLPRAIAVANTAWNCEAKDYDGFLNSLEELEPMLGKMGITLKNKEEWTKNRLKMIEGWLKFVKSNYSSDYIKSQMKE